MGSGWQIVAFPVILPWRQEFWTLPVYFPDLRVGVILGWPKELPYQGLPLPPEAETHPRELNHYRPGDLRQWQAFRDFQREQGEEGDLLQTLRRYGEEANPEEPAPPDVWSLAWQMEKIMSDQESQMQLVDQGDGWLKEILQPEPWEETQSFGPVPGVEETVDADLATLRYRLWRRVMASQLTEPWAPLLLGRTSRSLFLTLKGWPEWTNLQRVQLPLPGCRSATEWQQVAGEAGAPPWRTQFQDLLADLLAAAAGQGDLKNSEGRLKEFLANEVTARWPVPSPWLWDLEVWLPGPETDDTGPILCWSKAGAGVLPG
jgi:hypothetical protein